MLRGSFQITSRFRGVEEFVTEKTQNFSLAGKFASSREGNFFGDVIDERSYLKMNLISKGLQTMMIKFQSE